MKLRNILSSTSFWQLNKTLVLELGIDTALFLTDLSSRQDYWEIKGKLDKDGFFFINRDEIKEETTLSHSKQNKATKTLVELNILDVKKVGIPSKNHYKINVSKLNKYILNLVNNG